jgi:hypothetical protein
MDPVSEQVQTESATHKTVLEFNKYIREILDILKSLDQAKIPPYVPQMQSIAIAEQIRDTD